MQFQLGVVNLAENKYKEAEEAFRKTHELNPANPRGLMGMVETRDGAEHGRTRRCSCCARKPTRIPNSLDLRLAMGNIAVRAGQVRRGDAGVQSDSELARQELEAARRHLTCASARRTVARATTPARSTRCRRRAKCCRTTSTVLSTLALTLDHAGPLERGQAGLRSDAEAGRRTTGWR